MMSAREMTRQASALGDQLPSADDLLEAVGLQFRRSATEATLATVGAFVLGAAVGAVIALLTAPRSGRETREALQQQASQTADRVRERFEGVDERSGMR